MQTIGQRLVWAARAEIALARGDHTQALDITDKLIASATNLSEEVVVPLLWKLRGEALAGLGSPEEAATMLQVAQKAARTQGLQSLLWRICVSLGKLYQSQRRQKEAEQAFATARTIIEELATTIADVALRDNFMHQATSVLSYTPSNSSSQATKQAFGGLST